MLSATLLPYISLLVVIPLDDYIWCPQQPDLIVTEKVLQVGLINCVVILLPEPLVPYNFALSEVNLWPVRTW